MKKNVNFMVAMRVIAIIAAAAAIGLVVAACEVPEDLEYADLIGTWKFQGKTKDAFFIISEGEIQQISDVQKNDNYIATINGCVKSTDGSNVGQNAGYDAGFEFDVTVTEGTSSITKIALRLGNDGKTIRFGSTNPEIYVKQKVDNSIKVGDFYNTWECTNPKFTYEISGTELIDTYTNSKGETTITKYNFVSVAEVENVDKNMGTYPTGFLFIYKKEGETSTTISGNVFRLFMNKDKTKIEQVVYYKDDDGKDAIDNYEMTLKK